MLIIIFSFSLLELFFLPCLLILRFFIFVPPQHKAHSGRARDNVWKKHISISFMQIWIMHLKGIVGEAKDSAFYD
jgi:hypothetical protein